MNDEVKKNGKKWETIFFRYGQWDASTDDASRCRVPDATADSWRYKRAPGMSLLPTQFLVLLLAETTLSGQTRAIEHALRVWILQSSLSYEKFINDPQESSASWLERHAQEATENISNQERTGAASSHTAAAAAMKVAALSWLEQQFNRRFFRFFASLYAQLSSQLNNDINRFSSPTCLFLQHQKKRLAATFLGRFTNRKNRRFLRQN